ncbi:hypothetical protein GQ44DRAFT_628656 [Phaeosphaeriaceae sp. PMI808]|nr:hypothetical protein GQ44DRAFT_628656 [Phaeosphaeriaceae sp. PMI808]
MLNLINRVTQPAVTPGKSTIEAYFLSGCEAEAHLESDVTLYGPIITEHQQPFQWTKGNGRPIEQLFDRMWNLDRTVSVQDPSHAIEEKSCTQKTLKDVCRSFLDSASNRSQLNVLEMRNPLPRSTLPHFLTGKDCQLLSQVRDVVLDEATAQRISTTAKRWNEWKDDEEWILLAQGGAMTLAHQDSCGKATWLTVQEGLVGFGWVSRPTEDERVKWGQDPVNFCPGELRYVVLRPGQSVFFKSGTIHFVFRLQDTQTLMFGGHVLRWSRVAMWMDLLWQQFDSPDISNEDLSPRMVRTYVKAVEQLIKDRAERGLGNLVDNFADLKAVSILQKIWGNNY